MYNKEHYDVFDSSKVFLWALLLPQIVALIFTVVFTAILGEDVVLSEFLPYTIFCCLVAQICFVLVFIFYNKKNKINFCKASNINKPKDFKKITVCILISIIAVFGMINFIGIFEDVFNNLGFAQSGVSLPLNNFWWLLLNIFLLALLPAIFEELIFRGIIFNGLRKRGFWFATLISSLMFAVMHLSLYQFIYPFLMGILFCLIADKFGSTIYSTITHFCNNLIVILISYIKQNANVDIGVYNLDSWWKIILCILFAVFTSMVIVCIIKVFEKKSNKSTENISENLPKSKQDGIIYKDNNNSKNVSSNKNEITANIKFDKSQNYYIYGSLAVGVALWLIMVITSLF